MTRSTGTTTWLDLSTTDLKATIDFYSGLFGWDFEDNGEEFGHYQLIRKDGALVGGAMDVTGYKDGAGEQLPTSWGVFLAVDDVDARLAAAADAGGTVYAEAMDVGDFGRMGMVADSTGAIIGLWQAKGLEGYEYTGKPGSPVWFELMTHQYDAARDFYTRVFDASFVPMGEPMDDDFRYSTNGPGESASWGVGDATGVMPEDATGWRVYFGVAESDAALAKVTELGGKVLDGPVPSPFGTIATVADPTGATFQLCAMSEATPEG